MKGLYALNATAKVDFVSSEREDLSQSRTKSWFVRVYGELLFGQSRVRRHDAKPECSSM